jgi:hypothetical protein
LAELWPGQSVELLKDLHILTRDGALNQDSRRKLKQVLHLAQFIEPLLEACEAAEPQSPSAPLSIADHGAGKSYLGFMLADTLLRKRPRAWWVYAVEQRAELVERARALAARYGFERMRFVHAQVAEVIGGDALPARVDLVTALHACDGATDDAIAFALARRARAIVLVPCCQAEVAACLRGSKALALARTPLAELWRHPLHTREFGSQLTNVLRCLYLEACGYTVSVTELVGFEHSLKNELIVARAGGQRRADAARRLAALVDRFGLHELARRRYAALDARLWEQDGAARPDDGTAA